MTDQPWTWRVVDADGNVVAESYEPIELEMTTQLGDGLGLSMEEN